MRLVRISNYATKHHTPTLFGFLSPFFFFPYYYVRRTICVVNFNEVIRFPAARAKELERFSITHHRSGKKSPR